MSESLQNNGMQWTDLETDINREYSSREKKQQVTQVDVGREPPVCSHTLQTTSTVRFWSNFSPVKKSYKETSSELELLTLGQMTLRRAKKAFLALQKSSGVYILQEYQRTGIGITLHWTLEGSCYSHSCNPSSSFPCPQIKAASIPWLFQVSHSLN